MNAITMEPTFIRLASELSLTVRGSTILVVIAKHRDKGSDDRIQKLLGELEGESLEVANVLLGGKTKSQAVKDLAKIYKDWVDINLKNENKK